MKKYLSLILSVFIFVHSNIYSAPISLGAQLLSSTEADPDSFIDHKVNVINGDYCEVVNDLIIKGPDDLVMQRYYSNSNFVTGEGGGGWRIFPQCWLVVGKDPKGDSCTVSGSAFDWTYAFTGERSGSILTYSGWESRTPKDEGLRVWAFRDGKSMCNTSRGEISGKVNAHNNLLVYQGDCNGYVLSLGDGSKRFFEKCDSLPSDYLGEELNTPLSSLVRTPEFFRLNLEILPSGNKVKYSYSPDGHLSKVEMVSASEKKVFSWIKLDHQSDKKSLRISTSDERVIVFALNGSQIISTQSSFQPDHTYKYNKSGNLVEKIVAGKVLKVEYDKNSRVSCLKEPLDLSEKLYSSRNFSYGKGYTEVKNVLGQKDVYFFNKNDQLEAIEHYDMSGSKFRVDRKFWNRERESYTQQIARTIEDGNGNTLSCHQFFYDQSGNVIEERLYGNLTGKTESFLKMKSNGEVATDEESDCHVKSTEYTQDGFNLLCKLGDSKGNQTVFEYVPGTNLLTKKLVKEGGSIRKRTFFTYNEDTVLIQTVDDDGNNEKLSNKYRDGVTERHIKEIKPKEQFPGVGLPLEVLEQAAEYENGFEPYQVKRITNYFDAQGRLLKEDTFDAYDALRFFRLWEYESNGNLTKEVNPEGKETLYTYDSLGRCVRKENLHQNIISEYLYDYQGNVREVAESYGATKSTLKYSYDLLGKMTFSIDRMGNRTDYEYDRLGYLSAIVHPAMVGRNGKVIRPTQRYENDLFGNQLRTIDANGQVMTKRFNLRGDPISIDYSDGTYELFKYDPEGSIHRHMTRDKIISVFEYDFLGRQTNEERLKAGNSGSEHWIDNVFCTYSTFHLKNVKDRDAKVFYEYDGKGRLKKTCRSSSRYYEEDKESRLEEYFHDSLGRVSKKKIYFGSGENDFFFEAYEYDIAGRVVEKRIEDSFGTLLQGKRYVFDERGLPVEELSLLDGEYRTLVKTLFNDLGEPISIFDSEGKETRFLYETVVDRAGQNVLKKTVVDPMGVSTEIQFDAFNRITSLKKYSPNGKVLSQKAMSYDPVGNKVLEENVAVQVPSCDEQTGSWGAGIFNLFGGTDSKKVQKTFWKYGPMNRLEEMHEGFGTEQVRITSYNFGEGGKLVSKNLPGIENPLKFEYSELGQVEKITYGVEEDKDQFSIEYSYDKRGNITRAKSLTGQKVLRKYNSFDEVISETIIDGKHQYTVQYEYDRKGRVTQVTLPDESKLQYTYDALYGRGVLRRSNADRLQYTHDYLEYDQWGRLKEEKMLGFAGHRKKGWNTSGLMAGSFSDYYIEKVPSDGYDSLGNLLLLNREGDCNSSDLKYSYNLLSQLTSETSEFKNAYVYDSVGNRLQKGKEQYNYDILNQLISTPQDTFEYDLRGYVTKFSRGGEEWGFQSNVLGQLLSIQQDSNSDLEYSYCPFGRRIAKKSFSCKGDKKEKRSEVHYLYIGDIEVGVIDLEGNILELKVPGIYHEGLSGESVALELKGKAFAPLHDVRGNVVALVDPQWREVVESYSYSAFGEEKIFDADGNEIEESAYGNNWRYSEKRKDNETGFLYFGYRFYDPVIGRWLSPDPAQFVDGPNLYAFAQNNPIHYLDRFGLSTENRNSQEFEDYFYGEVEPHCYCEKHRTCKRGGDLGTFLTYGPEAFFVNFFDSFESPFSNKSKIYDISDESKFQELLKGRIMFINGMNTPFEEAQGHAKYVGNIAGGYNVHGVYNATHGIPLDLIECAINEEYVATPPVRLLHQKWNDYFAKEGLNTPILQVCHSQGAIHVRNALMSYPRELRERIIVVAIAPGAYIHESLCHSVVHFATKQSRDIIPALDIFGRAINSHNLVILPSREGAETHDHGFQSPTYKEELERLVLRYIYQYGGLR